MTNKKKINIFGSTGTIGLKTLDVIRENMDDFEIVSLVCDRNHHEIIKQIQEFSPKFVVVNNPDSYQIVREFFKNTNKNTMIFPREEMKNIASLDDIDILMMCISGSSGIIPSFQSIGHAKNIALATKEVVVSGGELFMNLARKYNTNIIPVDSEHNAIFQCLSGESIHDVYKLILTASGGPFRDLEEDELKYVCLDDALKHPNWKMGRKITIDSATLINKAIEIIEAAYLFNIDINKIQAVIHKESIIHGMIKFYDNSIKTLMCDHDMKIPIQYALYYPSRLNRFCDNFDINFQQIFSLNFQTPKRWQENSLNLAYRSYSEGKCIAFNVFNEYIVDMFLKGRVRFTYIYDFIRDMLDNIHSPEKISTPEDIFMYTDMYIKKAEEKFK